MSALYMLVGTLVALGVLVTIHEYGHFWVARRCGVKVLRFSVGFGSPLLRWHDRQGTEFVVAAIPLGGYVRFVGDMNPASVPDEAAIARAGPEFSEKLFVNKNVWQRIAIVAAGPLANVIFTFLILYALLLGYGRYTIPPVIGDVVAGSVAESAGANAIGAKQPPRRLAGFQRIELAPGASGEVAIRIDPAASNHPLGVWSEREGKWVVPSGTFTVWLGRSSSPRDLVRAGTIQR